MRFIPIIMLGVATLAAAAPTADDHPMTAMKSDEHAKFEIDQHGVLRSFDAKGNILESTQLDGAKFKQMTGCNLGADDTKECLDSFTSHHSAGVSSKRDGELFARLPGCRAFLCTYNLECYRITGAATRCLGCVGIPNSKYGVCVAA